MNHAAFLDFTSEIGPNGSNSEIKMSQVAAVASNQKNACFTAAPFTM